MLILFNLALKSMCYPYLILMFTIRIPYHICYESKALELVSEVTLYRVYTRELNRELCTE